jgi:phosphotransferase system HPr (HPr) family protein
MIEKNVNVKTDLEARHMALFVQLAGKFQSVSRISLDNKHTNCKSIMGMISLGVTGGSQVTITADGPDEKKCLGELSNFLES